MFRVAIITVSDSRFSGKGVDVSGEVIRGIAIQNHYEVVSYTLLPDEKEQIAAELRRICDENIADLILTTGGTGFSPRDCMPEATLEVAHRLVPGIPEAIRHVSFNITPRAMLSRAVAAIRNKTLIVNLPGSPKAVTESLEIIVPALDHGLEILTGPAQDCARKED